MQQQLACCGPAARILAQCCLYEATRICRHPIGKVRLHAEDLLERHARVALLKRRFAHKQLPGQHACRPYVNLATNQKANRATVSVGLCAEVAECVALVHSSSRCLSRPAPAQRTPGAPGPCSPSACPCQGRSIPLVPGHCGEAARRLHSYILTHAFMTATTEP